MVPSLIEEAFGIETLPYWMQKNELGFIFYMTIFSVSILAFTRTVLNPPPDLTPERAWLNNLPFGTWPNVKLIPNVCSYL